MKHYLGIDLGGTKIAVGVVDQDYNIIEKVSIPTLAHRPFETVVKDIAAATQGILEKTGLALSEFEYLGIGVPSSVDPVTHNIVFANNLNWKNACIAEELRTYLDIQVLVANDADCATLAEAACGAGKVFKDVLMLTLGTGVGGGVVLNNKIFTGGKGFGCEPGHFTLIMNGLPCTCGRSGCLEVYASVTALIRQTIEMMARYPHSAMRELCNDRFSEVNGKTAFDAAKLNDDAGKQVVRGYIDYLAAGIASLNTVFLPEAVILGGGISNEGDYLMVPLRSKFNELVPNNGLISPPQILKATLGNDAGIIGAALLGVDLHLMD